MTFLVILAAVTTHMIALGLGLWHGRRLGLRDGWHIGRLAGLREERCAACGHATHPGACTHQVRRMDDVYRDCGCVDGQSFRVRG